MDVYREGRLSTELPNRYLRDMPKVPWYSGKSVEPGAEF